MHTFPDEYSRVYYIFLSEYIGRTHIFLKRNGFMALVFLSRIQAVNIEYRRACQGRETARRGGKETERGGEMARRGGEIVRATAWR